jgi:hypothetical protein
VTTAHLPPSTDDTESSAALPCSGGAAPARDALAVAVREAVARIRGLRPEEIAVRDRFGDDLGFDSVMLMELKYRLSSRFPDLEEVALPDLVPGLVDVGTLTDHLKLMLDPLAA